MFKKIFTLRLLVLMLILASCTPEGCSFGDIDDDYEELYLDLQEENGGSILGGTNTGGNNTTSTGTNMSLRCDDPTSFPTGYHCLQNSGGAKAPHKYDIDGIKGTTWYYENVCITYNPNGSGTARFKQPNGSVQSKSIRWGILVNSKGTPEVLGGGQWLLSHEGIGDPQVEGLTFNPSTKKIGESWPFTKGSCPF